MNMLSYKWFFTMILLICAFCNTECFAQERTVLTCTSRRSRCFLKKIPCPRECPLTRPKDSKAKVCYVNCDSPICKAERKHRKPSCTGGGAACYDPRLIGADGVVFYFHGKINHHYTLVSDNNLQINARFIGHRPATRTRDYTWIQALGIRFGSHTLSVEVTKSSTWNNNIDHLKLSFDGNDVVLPQTALSAWESRNGDVKLERLESQNSVAVSVNGIVEIGVNVVPISKEEDRVHNYQLPSDDCFAHLEVQFRFLSLSAAVEGVLGRTYRRDYESRARLGVAMAVVGGEDEYRVASLFDVDCKKCVFSKTEDGDKVSILEKIDYGLMDCSHKLLSGNGIVCKK